MTAPAFPLNPRSPAADDLHGKLEYMQQLHTLLVGRVRPAGQSGLLSRNEMALMVRCHGAGWSAEAFADFIRARDARGGAA